MKIEYTTVAMYAILRHETLARNNLMPDRDVRLSRVNFFDMGMALVRGFRN